MMMNNLHHHGTLCGFVRAGRLTQWLRGFGENIAEETIRASLTIEDDV